MYFGVDVPNHGPYGDPKLLLELAVEAEAAGWNGFFIWDHPVPTSKRARLAGHIHNPAVLAATEQGYKGLAHLPRAQGVGFQRLPDHYL